MVRGKQKHDPNRDRGGRDRGGRDRGRNAEWPAGQRSGEA